MITKKLFKKDELIELYTYDDSVLFTFGIVRETDETGILIHRIGKSGYNDGYEYIKYEDISIILTKTEYIKKYLKILETRGKIESTLDIKTNSIMQEILENSNKNNILVKVSLYSNDADDIIGEVDLFDEDVIKIFRYDTYGKKDGHAIIPVENVRTISINTIELNNISIVKEQ